jgi:hypothetical protein
MTCSQFVTEGWKAAFSMAAPWNEIQGTEATPKDNYISQMFNGTYYNANNCPRGGLRTTPQGTYCQWLGHFQLDLKGYNTIPLYAGQNNRCPSQWTRDPATRYVRCPANDPMCC